MVAGSQKQHSGGLGAAFIAASKPLDKASQYIMVGTMSVMTLVVCFQVVLRFFFSHSIDWADEIARLLFVWSMFLAIPHGIKYGSHVGIEALTYRMPPHLKNGIARAMQALCAVLCAIVFVVGVLVVAEKWDELMPTIDFTSSVYYFPVLFAMVHSFVHFCILLVCGMDVWKQGEDA